MRFTRITGKPKQYVLQFFRNMIYPLNTNIFNRSATYIQNDGVIYHVETIRDELGQYMERWVERTYSDEDINVNQVAILTDLTGQLRSKTWYDLFQAKSIEDLLTPIKMEAEAKESI